MRGQNALLKIVTKQKHMKKDCFPTLRIRITNGWNKECLGGEEGRVLVMPYLR